MFYYAEKSVKIVGRIVYNLFGRNFIRVIIAFVPYSEKEMVVSFIKKHWHIASQAYVD